MKLKTLLLKNSENATIESTYCPTHTYNEAILFCNSCESSCFCAQCVLEGKHCNHDIYNLIKDKEKKHPK